jgi:hypothetical protein
MCVRKLPLQKSSSSSPATAPEKSLMRYGVDSFSSSNWEPQDEGMMNIAARFSLSKKPRYVGQERKKPIQLKVMLASLVTLQQGRRLRSNELARLQLVAPWNLHTTQPNTLFPTYDEVVNLTGLL